MGLREIRKEWKTCRRCPLAANRDKVVVGSYWPATRRKGMRVMVIGGAPDRTEDSSGKPFVGLAGKMFREQYLGQAGVTNSFVTNIVGCRTPSDRAPEDGELNACARRVKDLVDYYSPEAFVLVGITADEAKGVLPDGATVVEVVGPKSILRQGYPATGTSRELLAKQIGIIRRILPEDPDANPIETGVDISLGRLFADGHEDVELLMDSGSARITTKLPSGDVWPTEEEESCGSPS